MISKIGIMEKISKAYFKKYDSHASELEIVVTYDLKGRDYAVMKNSNGYVAVYQLLKNGTVRFINQYDLREEDYNYLYDLVSFYNP